MERTRVYVVYHLDSIKRTNAWRDLYCIAYLHTSWNRLARVLHLLVYILRTLMLSLAGDVAGNGGLC